MAYIDYLKKVRGCISSKNRFLCDINKSVRWYYIPYRLNPYYWYLQRHIQGVLDTWNVDNPTKLPSCSMTGFLRKKYPHIYVEAISMDNRCVEALLREKWLTDVIKDESEKYPSPRGPLAIMWAMLKSDLYINSTFVGISFTTAKTDIGNQSDSK